MAVNIEEQVAQEMKELGLKTMSTVSNSVLNVTQRVLQILFEQSQLRKDLKLGGEVELIKLQNAVRHGEKLNCFVAGDEVYDDFRKILIEQNVLFASATNMFDDGTIIFFLEKDTAKIEKAINVMNVRTGMYSEIDPSFFINYVAEDEIGFVVDVDEVDLEMFRHYVKDKEIPYSVRLNDENKYDILYNVNDKDEVKNIFKRIGWDLNNKAMDYGERIREQIEYKINCRTKIRDVARSGQEYFIVNGNQPSHYIHLNNEGMAYYKNGAILSREKRKSPLYMDSIDKSLGAMVHPVVLTKEEFELSFDERKRLIEKRLDIFPENEYYDQVIDENRRLRFEHLVEMGINDKRNKELQEKMEKVLDNRMRKTALDNEGDSHFAICDDSITYANFAIYEDITDTEEFNAAERSFDRYKESVSYANKYEFVDIKLEEKSLDYAVQKYESMRQNALIVEPNNRVINEHEY